METGLVGMFYLQSSSMMDLESTYCSQEAIWATYSQVQCKCWNRGLTYSYISISIPLHLTVNLGLQNHDGTI